MRMRAARVDALPSVKEAGLSSPWWALPYQRVNSFLPPSSSVDHSY